jgi:hypothetical protein
MNNLKKTQQNENKSNQNPARVNAQQSIAERKQSYKPIKSRKEVLL